MLNCQLNFNSVPSYRRIFHLSDVSVATSYGTLVSQFSTVSSNLFWPILKFRLNLFRTVHYVSSLKLLEYSYIFMCTEIMEDLDENATV